MSEPVTVHARPATQEADNKIFFMCPNDRDLKEYVSQLKVYGERFQILVSISLCSLLAAVCSVAYFYWATTSSLVSMQKDSAAIAQQLNDHSEFNIKTTKQFTIIDTRLTRVETTLYGVSGNGVK